MAAETEFCLLGPLLVRHRGNVVPVPPGQQRALLTALLLGAGRLVTVDELGEALWGATPPLSARTSLHNSMMRLRRSLAEAGISRIVTQPDGYLLSVGPGELDVDQFESALTSARAAARAGSWADAVGVLQTALALWRGQPLSGVPSDSLIRREAPRLAEMRLQALEVRIDADLHLGRHADVILELRQLATAYPLRERLHALLMIALYRDGQQAAALAAYRAARSVLIDELGAEPGQQLRHLQQQILTGDPALAAPASPGANGGSPEPAGPLAAQQSGPEAPRQLPAAATHFVGRADELAALTGMLDQAAGEGRTVVISAIAGTAGVGKTALAVHWAQQVADRFPDGQLYVNLRGYDPGQPLPAADALAEFLRALGVPGQDIPAAPDERAARYRSLLARQRMLVVLDNAGEVEQVRPLLPGTAECVVVVTSRDSLAGLVARDGARRVDLDLLPPAEAAGLLRALIGGRADADPGAAATLAVQCARLPLALRVAAELAAARPAVPLADLVAELADQQRRLDQLNAGGDPRTAVRAVFSWSYRYLDAAAAGAFGLLGLHPGCDVDPYAAAALTGTTLEQASRVLDQLARAHLIHTTGPARYGMHDLLRAYARELAADRDTEEERRAALTRLFDYYLHTAAAAMDTLFPAERQRRPRIPPQASPAPPLAVPAAARAWLDGERATLVATTAYMTGDGWPGQAICLAATLFRYLDTGGHYSEAVTIHTHARRAARHAGERAAEANALTSLGVADMRQDRYQQSAGHHEQALALFRETGDRTGEARALANLGHVEFQRGRYQQAAGHHEQALALFRETGDQTGEARALNNLGYVELRLGRYQRAAGHLQCALALFRQTGNRTGEARALIDLGAVDLRQGRYQQASSYRQEALAVFRETGNRSGEAGALADLGAVDLQQGCYQQAIDRHQEALALFREIGERSGEAEALNGLGEVFLATGRPGDARAQHTAALGLASQIGEKYQQARAHNGLACAHHATGDPCQAHHHWQEALTLYTDLGTPEAAQVRAQLTTTDEDGRRTDREGPVGV